MLTNGTVACWGDNGEGQAPPDFKIVVCLILYICILERHCNLLSIITSSSRGRKSLVSI
jgi:hypothetical protein